MLWPGTFIANDVPPSRTGQASFDFTFGVSILGDIDGDGTVGIVDFLLLLAAWGPCSDPCPPSCPADLDGDCVVGIIDSLALLGNWGRRANEGGMTRVALLGNWVRVPMTGNHFKCRRRRRCESAPIRYRKGGSAP